jgi:Spy/CpxP family protein refolding chaperone
MNTTVKSVISVIAIVIAFAVSSQGQTPATEAPPPPPPQRHFGGGDPVRQLNLTPEQREQIRLIREQLRNERAVVNQRVRETNKALEEVLDSDSPDQSIIEQRIQEVSAAQAAAMRMRIMTEVKIRQVLTTEQRTMLRELRRNVDTRREVRVLGNEDRQRRLERRTRQLEQRRNRIRPMLRDNEGQRPQ